jgi:hypothetical protein
MTHTDDPFPIENGDLVRCSVCGDPVLDRTLQKTRHGIRAHDDAFTDYEEP